MTAANDGFIKPSVINVGGRPVTIPATLRMAANAGSVAKNALRLNPGVIVGTLAAGWLAQEGMEWINDQWQRADTSPGAGYSACTGSSGTGSNLPPGTIRSNIEARWTTRSDAPAWFKADAAGRWDYRPTTGAFEGVTIDYMQCHGTPGPAYQPATPEDWDALPDPSADLAPELPYAPYMPEGVPVEEPEFAPQIVPLGLPYTAPDGSTWQPMADIQPAGDGKVRVRTYDDPLTDPQGNPVPSGTPPIETETPPEPLKIPDICVDHPDVAACAKQGDVPAPDVIPTHTINFSTVFSPIGGSGSCPADVTTSRFGITWSYQPICDFASAIRPIVVAFAWLGFAFIIVAGLRK